MTIGKNLRPFMAGAFLVAAQFLLAGQAVYGSSEYGGGWAVPSLDVSLSIGQAAASKAVTDGILRKNLGKGAAPSTARTGPTAFSAALAARPGAADGSGRFVRSADEERRSEARILKLVGQSQGPQAVQDYQRAFAQFGGLSAMFRKSTAGYGLRDDDVADALAAYWLAAWAVVNDARDFTPAAAKAVRDQVAAGIVTLPLASEPAARRQQVADEAIFNMIVAAEVHAMAGNGRISREDYRRVGAVTRQAFLGFGTDLAALQLTDQGFRQR